LRTGTTVPTSWHPPRRAAAEGDVVSNDLSDVRFLTVAEVADMMRVSKMTVYRMVHSGELPAIRFGRSFRVPESAVAAVLRTGVADVG
jgi:excisionase family DNA binding protein